MKLVRIMNNFIKCLSFVIVLTSVLDLGYCASNTTQTEDDDDTVVVEALVSPDSSFRQGRQFPNFRMLYQPFQPFREGSTCISTTGAFGLCVKFNSCSPHTRNVNHFLRQSPELANPWFLQGEAICSFFDNSGRQMTGICCGSSDLQSAKPNREQDSSEIEISDKKDEDNNINYDPEEIDDGSVQPYQFNWPPRPAFPSAVPAQWPPPLPTHGPSISQWPPPLPTHPPNHHYPTHPPHPALPSKPPAPTASSSRPTYPSYRPTHRPTQRPPTYPSYPPTSSARPPTTTEQAATSVNAKCGAKNGVSADQERIVGGQNSSPNEWPWVVVLFNKGKQFCGGSMIDNVHVLTAAHCVARMTSWDVAGLTAHLGDHNIRTSFEVQHVERRIKRLVRHKGFEFSTLHNDVAILTLDKPVTFTREIRPICLPYGSFRKSYTGQVATVAGWGSLRENGPQPSVLQKVSIPIWSNLDCARKYGRAAPGGIIDSMLCAGQAARDSCSGDSGGPLMINEGGTWTQVGIVSWGIGCGKGQYPGVYTRVSAFLPWILKNLK
ncbi:serine proteinase stubble [Eupeodes corollae]|uniref:serine proteinase stubble n=1 Tax=Eupeodes corollae TaxID=290404 RepID=UPI00248F5E7A|nr:serine proteinase stubble [Eupeodes corollae]